MRKQKISLLLVSRNEERFAKSFFKSLKEQTRKPDEVILVDSSTDKTPKIARPFVDKIIRAEKPTCAFQRWKGMQIVKGNLIALTDLDTKLDKHWLEELEKKMLSSPEISIVTGTVLYGEIKHKVPPLENAPVHHCNALYKRKVLEEFAFDKTLPRFESVDLQYRYGKKYKVYGAPKAIVHHYGSFDTDWWQKMKKYQEGSVILIIKHKSFYMIARPFASMVFAAFIDLKPMLAVYSIAGFARALLLALAGRLKYEG